MGRPPIGKTDDAHRVSAAVAAETTPATTAAERTEAPVEIRQIDPDIQLASDQADRQRIEGLTRQLDQARRELAAAHQGIGPRAAGPDDPGRCFYCLKRQDEVKVMLKATRPRFTVFTCNECVDEMRDEIIARKT
jgi:hypothetical protein